jgi:hypothetical protein
VGYPWTLAGFLAGSWTLDEEGRAPRALPLPGVVGAQDALGWFDSLSVVSGEDSGWDGFEASLARARLGPGLIGRPAGGWQPRSDLVLTNASRGLADHALGLWRGDSLGGFRVEAASGDRATAGALAGAGRDLYDIAAAKTRGRHRFEAAFAHRRAQASLTGGEAEEMRGEAGSGGYQYSDGRWRVDASFARGYDRLESWSFDVPSGSRLADANAAVLEVSRGHEQSRLGLRASWSESRVAAIQDSGARTRVRGYWGAARWERPFAEGWLEASLGIGRHGAFSGTKLAPSIAWRFRGAPWSGRMVLERLLTPIWADLAPGQSSFLQDTWVAGLEARGDAAGGGRARVSFLAGRSHDRALLTRLPLESLALRSGFRADARAYDFGLLEGDARWRTSRWSAGVEGFALAREDSPIQPWVDPGRGGRAFAEVHFALFQGDLHVRPRIEAWGIGPRESEASPSRRLPSYVTYAAGLELTLADVVVLIEGRNLENRARRQTWVDSATGVEALGPGRELRTSILWRLWN